MDIKTILQNIIRVMTILAKTMEHASHLEIFIFAAVSPDIKVTKERKKYTCV